MKIHLKTGNIYCDNQNTNKSIYDFFQAQGDHQIKKPLDINYSNHITKYLTGIKDVNDDKYDMLTHKTSKFLFYQFNNYLPQINKPVKYIKHTEIADDDFALGVLQEKNWPYFIERLLEVCTNLAFENIVGIGNPENVKIINDSLQNLTICNEL